MTWFWWLDVGVPHPSFDVDPAAMWQQDLWWWFLMIWCLCVPDPSFDVGPAAMWQQDLCWWFWWIFMIWCLCSSSFFWCRPGCNVTTRPLVTILMIWCLCVTHAAFDVFACVLHAWYFLKDSECQFGVSLHQTGTPGCPFLTDTKLPPYRTLQIPSKRSFLWNWHHWHPKSSRLHDFFAIPKNWTNHQTSRK
jgi:hypothetical protein